MKEWVMEYEKRTLASILEWKYSTHTLFMSSIDEMKRGKSFSLYELQKIVNSRANKGDSKEDIARIINFISSILSVYQAKSFYQNDQIINNLKGGELNR